jgi:predicted metal-binding membrane protein
VATGVQRVLAELLLISPMMELTSPAAGATVLIVAGVYQWTPLKRACLKACESPLGFLMRGWQDNVSGAFRLGLEHGLLCLGCCWALMLLLFAGGVMNLAVIAALTVFVAFEKLGAVWTVGHTHQRRRAGDDRLLDADALTRSEAVGPKRRQ